jgi:hypothetical protein
MMEIQWVIIARELTVHSDATVSIMGIIHHIDRRKLDMMQGIKVIFKPNEVGETKTVIMQLLHENNSLGGVKIPYTIHDLDTWLNKVPYAYLPLDRISFPNPGRYTFRLFVDKSYREESITVD